MGQDFHFGGGAAGSTMHPVVMVLVLIVSVGVLILPRRLAFAPVLFIAFLTPFGEQLYVGGFHFYTIRIVILAGCARLVWVKASSSKPLFGVGLSPIDRTFFLWAFFRAVTFILLYRAGGAVIAQIGFWLDAYGGYMLFRYFIQDKEDIFRAVKTMSIIAAILAPCMLFEYLTHINVFNFISTNPIVPWVREGRFRAQGTFTENSITAGAFGAVLLPLFYWLWKSGKGKLAGIIGLAASTVIVFTSVASTAAMAYLGAIFALLLWPIRNRMRTVRWSTVLAVICLALVMKAPVWFLIARVDFVGGHGWDRAEMIDVTIRHFPDWWLLGSKDNATWGNDTWDSVNQFVAEALTGGLISLVLFVTLITRGFSLIGIARKYSEGERDTEWFYWCLGAALFANLMAFTGVDYMDMMEDWWFIFLAIISAATIPAWAPKTIEEAQSYVGFPQLPFTTSLPPAPLLGRSRLPR